MVHMPTITTIIPVYNSSPTIKYTLESITGQSRQSDQIIVVDDGSTDNTFDMVSKYREIECFKQANSGVSAARNAGVKNAASEWIAFCDADDLWHQEKLGIIEQCIKKFQASRFFFHDFYRFEHNGDRMRPGAENRGQAIFPVFSENKNLTFKDIFSNHQNIQVSSRNWTFAHVCRGHVFPWLLLGNFILPSAVVIKKSFFDSLGGFDINFRTAEDTEFFLRASMHSELHYIDLPLTGYRESTNGLTSNIERLLDNGMKAVFKNAVNDPEQYRLHKKNIHISIARRYGRMGAHQLIKKHRLRAWRFCLKGLKYSLWQKSLWKLFILSLLPFSFLARLGRLKKNMTKLMAP